MADEQQQQQEVHRFWRLINRFENIFDIIFCTIISESALRVHMIIFWLYVLGQLLHEKANPSSNPSMVIALISGTAVVLAMAAASNKKAVLLLPLASVSFLESIRYTAYYLIIILKNEKLREWLPTTDFLAGYDIIIYAFAALYFLIVMATTLFIYFEYKDNSRRREMLEDSLAQLPPHLALYRHPNFILPQAEIVERNFDSPPNYSRVIREAPEENETAKEETSPPRYSQLGGERRSGRR